MRRALHFAAAVLCLFPVSGAFAKDTPKEPWSWPALPGEEQVKSALATKSESGFVILDRRCSIELRTLNAGPEGVKRDEFIRYLVVSDEAARKATVTVNDDPDSKIAFIEGRTVAPGGGITAVDEKRDVKRVDVSNLRRRELSSSLAEVAFPAPVKGAILDLHFSTTFDGRVFYYVQPLVYPETPSREMEVDVTIKGWIPGVPWSTLTVGDSDGTVRLEYMPSGAMKVHVAPFTPRRRLAFEPPTYHLLPTLICTLDLASLRLKGADEAAMFRVAQDVDSRGCVTSVDFPTARHREYWAKYLSESAKSDKEFVERPGAASMIDVTSIAPAALPLEERAARLYRAAQERAGYSPDEEPATTLSALMKKGMSRRWQAALLYSYLLERAKIPHRVGVAADRYAIRFTAVIRNENLFAFEKVVAVDVPGKEPVFAMPGYLGLPFGCLPDWYENSLAFLPQGENDLEYKRIPANPLPLDGIAFRYELDLDQAGDVSGKVALNETGAPAVPFFRWNKYRLYRQAHPARDEKRSAATVEKERKDELERMLAAEFDLPGNKLTLTDYSVPSSAPAPEQPVEASASVVGKGIGTPAQGRWLVYANPVLAGFTNPFSEDLRLTPIWYGKGGHFVVEGEVRLPAGASVVELPRAADVAGPLGTRASSKVEAIERGGRTVLYARVEFDQPSVIGSDQDRAWRAYQAEVARIAQERCIVSMSAAKELE